MRKYKEIIETTIIEGEKTEKKKKQFIHTIRSWDELTREEKEEKIQENSEIIYQDYQDMLYEDFKINLDEIREDFKDITFDEIYFDSSSQGSWIDTIKNFKLNASINVCGEDLWVDEVVLHFGRGIKDDFEIYIDDYYVDSNKLAKIEKTKKYQNWMNDLHTLVGKWIDRVNEATMYMLNREYSYPYNLDDEEDSDWLEGFFEYREFETIEEVK